MLISALKLKELLGEYDGSRLFNILRTSQISGIKTKNKNTCLMHYSYDKDEIIQELERKIKDNHRLSKIDDLKKWLLKLKNI